MSQNWANELAQKDAALHRSNNAYGENIFIIMSPQKVTDLGTRAVDYWYSEISFFDFYGTNEDMDAAVKACNLFKNTMFKLDLCIYFFQYKMRISNHRLNISILFY